MSKIKIFTVLDLKYHTHHYMKEEGSTKAKKISADKWFKLYDQIKDSNSDVEILPPLTERENV